MKSMTVGQKISLACAVLVALTLALSVSALVSLGRLNAAAQTVVSDPLPSNYVAGRLDSGADRILVMMNMHIQSESPEEMTRLESQIAEARREWEKDRQQYNTLITDDADRAIAAKVDTGFRRIMEAWDKIQPLSRALRNKEAYAQFHDQAVPAMEGMNEALSRLVTGNKANGERLGQEAEQTYRSGSALVWGVLIISIVSGLLLTYVIVRSVNGALRRTAADLAEGARQVASAAAQVSSSSQHLAQGSSEQAASFEETSASTEEINSMAHRNSEHSRSAAELVTQSQQQFAETNAALSQMVVAMAEINSSSDKISRIIKVIDEIAFQTNILALNAAVEAARAGEAGMGFAVVADEVRNLAQRSAQAAKDTASLIEESIARSNGGKAKVDQVAAALGAIIESASKVKTLVDEVSLGSQEQTRGIDQVAKAIVQLEKVTQSNAASAEQSASAAAELTAQSENLKEVVAQLNLLVGGNPKEPQLSKPPAARLEAAAATAVRVGRSSKIDRSAFVLDEDPAEMPAKAGEDW